MITRSPERTRRIGCMAAILAIGLLPVAGFEPVAAADKAPAPEPPALPSVPKPPDGHAVPEVPRPPKKVEKLMTGTKYFELKAGETHEGDLYFMSESVRIDGTLDGDLSVFGRQVEVGPQGKVTGDLNAWVQTATLEGTMGDTVRVFCGDLTVNGKVDGDLISVCGQIEVEKGTEITGDADLKGASIDFRGKTHGSLSAVGGQVTLAGEVHGDAALKGDVVNLLPGAEVRGDLDYSARDPIAMGGKEIVGGEVTYNREEDDPPVSTGGFLKWFFFTATALLAGLGTVALFRTSAPGIVAAVREDALRSAGIGFITVTVVPVAALISCILIITIPAVILVLVALILLCYLSQVPVALWLGEWVLGKVGRPASSPFIALLAGVPLLYIVFAVPFIGKLAILATLFVGFGAIVISLWTVRQARRAGTLPPGGAPMSPSAPVSSAV